MTQIEVTQFLQSLLYIVVTAIVPITLPFVIKLVKAQVNKIDNQKVKELLDMAFNDVSVAVTQVTQTYVDSLKKEGKFDEVTQKVAFEKAKTLALELINKESKEAITKMHGDLNNYIDVLIEKAVHDTKMKK